MDPQFDPILSERELAKWLATSCPTLQRHRSNGSGPPFIRLSARRVGYRKSAVEKWLQSRTTDRIETLASERRVGTRSPFNVDASDEASLAATMPQLEGSIRKTRLTSRCDHDGDNNEVPKKPDHRIGAKT
jgi:predicted DNA-binding transcriptional regulator AlpA